MSFLFENLHVYQMAIDFAEQVFTLTGGFPYKHRSLSEQLRLKSNLESISKMEAGLIRGIENRT